MISLPFLLMLLLLLPQQFHSVIGERPLVGSRVLCVGTKSDGDITIDYFVRIRGGNDADDEWVYIGWNIDPVKECVTAVTPDGRFSCLGADTKIDVDEHWRFDEAPLMVIYDRETDAIWPTESAQRHPMSFWREAWEELRRVNPDLPPSP
jgi:hypothetical protein